MINFTLLTPDGWHLHPCILSYQIEKREREIERVILVKYCGFFTSLIFQCFKKFNAVDIIMLRELGDYLDKN